MSEPRPRRPFLISLPGFSLFAIAALAAIRTSAPDLPRPNSFSFHGRNPVAVPGVALPILYAPRASPREIAQPPALTLTREITIDGNTEDLVRVTWVRVAPDGRIAFSQFDDKLVRFYDANGRAIGRFGRGGDGPGEFRGTNHAGWFGDSLWVQDVQRGRITVIPPSLRDPRVFNSMRGFLRHVNLKLPLFTIARLEGITPTGEILAGGQWWEDSLVTTVPPALRNVQRGFVTARSFSGYDKVIGTVQSPQDAYVAIGTQRYSVPLTSRTMTAAAHNGSRIVIVEPEVSGQHAGTFLVTAIGPTGDTLLTTRHPFVMEPIPNDVWQKSLGSRIDAMRRESDEAVHAAAYDAQVKKPGAYPPFSSVLVGRDGSIWIVCRATSAGRPHIVLDSRGNMYGQFVLPQSNTIQEADLNNIWTVELDANDVPSVVRYRISKSG